MMETHYYKIKRILTFLTFVDYLKVRGLMRWLSILKS